MSEKTYKITIEGQTLENLPAEIAGDDAKLKAALQPFFPGAANAKFMRSEKDGVVTVNVIKQAGTKGRKCLRANIFSDRAVNALIGCPESRNPVITLEEELREFDPRKLSAEQMLALDGRIRKTLEEGQAQFDAILSAESRLEAVRAIAADETPQGL